MGEGELAVLSVIVKVVRRTPGSLRILMKLLGALVQTKKSTTRNEMGLFQQSQTF